MSSLHNGLTIDFLPVYYPSKEEISNPKLYANNVQKLMALALRKTRTQHTYDDARLMMKGMELGLPEDACLLEYAAAKDMTGLGFHDFMKLLHRFAELDRDKDGYLTVSDLKADLQWPIEEDVDELFNEYDTARRGKVDYREYVMGYNDLCKDLIRHSDLCSSVFKAISPSGGQVRWECARKMFTNYNVSVDASHNFQHVLESLSSTGDLYLLLERQPELSYLLQKRHQHLLS